MYARPDEVGNDRLSNVVRICVCRLFAHRRSLLTPLNPLLFLQNYSINYWIEKGA